MTRPPSVAKAFDSFWRSFGVTIGQRIVTSAMLAGVAFIVVTGKGMIRAVYAQETRSVMAPPIDSLHARIDTMQGQVDTIRANQKALVASVQQMQRAQLEMYSAQLQKDTALQRILEDRATNAKKAADARAKTEKLFNDLTGGKE